MIILCLTINAAAREPVVNPIVCKGAGEEDDEYLIVPRHAFYDLFEDGPSITIEHPTNTTYYVNNQVVNGTVNETSTCQYRINSNDWNNITVTNKAFSETVTFPAGLSTLTLNCTKNGVSQTTQVVFTVQAFVASAIGDLNLVFIIIGLFMLYLLFID